MTVSPSEARKLILSGKAPKNMTVGSWLDLSSCIGLTNVAWFARPAGAEHRLGPVCRVNGGTRVSLGCWLDSPAATYAAIARKYGPDSEYESIVREAVERFERMKP